ncbi:unnamed protein product [Boreogadus saida]
MEAAARQTSVRVVACARPVREVVPGLVLGSGPVDQGWPPSCNVGACIIILPLGYEGVRNPRRRALSCDVPGNGSAALCYSASASLTTLQHFQAPPWRTLRRGLQPASLLTRADDRRRQPRPEEYTDEAAPHTPFLWKRCHLPCTPSLDDTRDRVSYRDRDGSRLDVSVERVCDQRADRGDDRTPVRVSRVLG